MPLNLEWTTEREEFYRERPKSSLEELMVERTDASSPSCEDWIDAEARGEIIPYRSEE